MPRPRAFDKGKALDQAMEVFWKQGYDGASIAHLTKAMGLNSPSIYGAFGNKRSLFDAVLERYDVRRSDYLEHVVSGTTALEVAKRLLYGAVAWLTASTEPAGCLLVQAGLAASGDGGDIPSALAERRHRLTNILVERFEKAKRDGDLAKDAKPLALANYLETIFSGLAVQAAAGVSATVLEDVVARAMRGWPAQSGDCSTAV